MAQDLDDGTSGAVKLYYYDAASARFKPAAGIDGGLISGENQQFDRLAGGAIAPYATKTATGVVSAVPAVVYGYIVTTAMSAAATTVYDNASAASGNVLFVIPASKAVGEYALPCGMIATAGIYASFAGTGTVNFLYVPAA